MGAVKDLSIELEEKVESVVLPADTLTPKEIELLQNGKIVNIELIVNTRNIIFKVKRK